MLNTTELLATVDVAALGRLDQGVLGECRRIRAGLEGDDGEGLRIAVDDLLEGGRHVQADIARTSSEGGEPRDEGRRGFAGAEGHGVAEQPHDLRPRRLRPTA